MENPAVNKTYDCKRFCTLRCSDFTLESQSNLECIEAKDNCTCRPMWKAPATWLTAFFIFSIFVTIGRLIYMYLKKKKAKNASAIMSIGQDQGQTPVATRSTAKEAREPEPAGTKTGLPAAQSIVVESTVSETPL